MDRTSMVGLALGLVAGGLALGGPSSAHAKPYKGGELYSSQAYLHGRIEARMRMARGSGLLSTFFTYKDGSEIEGTFWEEIDIEVFGKDNAVGWQSNIITGLGSRTTSEQVHTGPVSLADDYHTYALEWTPDHVAWELDGVVVRETTGGQVGELTNPQTLRFNLWAANIESWVGPFDGGVLPQYQYVNWIRYFRYEGGQFVHEWTDDFDSLDAGRWGRADWTFGENLVDFVPNNVVVRDGTLILALTREGQTGFSGAVPQDSGGSAGSGGATGSGGGSSDAGGSTSGSVSGGGAGLSGSDGGGWTGGGGGLGGRPDGGVTGSGGANVGGSETGGTTAAGGGPASGAVGGFVGSGGAAVSGSGMGGLFASGGHGLGGAAAGGNGSANLGGSDLAGTSGGGSSVGGVGGSGGTSAGPGQDGSGTGLGGRASGGAVGSGGVAVGLVGTSSTGGSTLPIGSGGANASEPPAGAGEDDGGCSCRMPSQRVRYPGAASLLLAGLVWGIRRRDTRTERTRRRMPG